MNNYFLMHENSRIAIFSIDELNQITKIAISNTEEGIKKLPPGVNDLKTLKYWLLHRGIPVSRKDINKDLNILKIESPFELMLQNNGLSLTDHYWICRSDLNYTWEKVNLYTNQFESAYSLDLQDDKRSIAGKTNFIPSTSLKGDLKKKWIIDQNGIRKLIKGNYNNACRQSICEVFATEIHKRQNKIKYTPYKLINITSNGKELIGCECPNFTDITTEFIPAIDIINNLKKPNELSYYEFFIQICLRNGIDIRKFLEYQIMTDFIISNTDRHLNNFGILRNSKTLEWVSYAPLFDSGNSMFYKEQYIPIDKALLNIEVTSFLSKEVNLLKYVNNRGLVDIEKLPDDNYLFNLLKNDTIIEEEINERLVKAYNKKIKYLSDFQNGADIWSYKYKG